MSGIASGIPSTLSQQFPRETIPKCASSDGETILPEGVTFSSICASYIKPQGAVASSREWTTAAKKPKLLEALRVFSWPRKKEF